MNYRISMADSSDSLKIIMDMKWDPMLKLVGTLNKVIQPTSVRSNLLTINYQFAFDILYQQSHKMFYILVVAFPTSSKHTECSG